MICGVIVWWLGDEVAGGMMLCVFVNVLLRRCVWFGVCVVCEVF